MSATSAGCGRRWSFWARRSEGAVRAVNAQSVIELFTLMMAKHPKTKHFRIYLDNARYQHAKVLKE